MKILELGCGTTKIPNAISVDINPFSKADVIHDLNKFPYPFKNILCYKHCINIFLPKPTEKKILYKRAIFITLVLYSFSINTIFFTGKVFDPCDRFNNCIFFSFPR